MPEPGRRRGFQLQRRTRCRRSCAVWVNGRWVSAGLRPLLTRSSVLPVLLLSPFLSSACNQAASPQNPNTASKADVTSELVPQPGEQLGSVVSSCESALRERELCHDGVQACDDSHDCRAGMFCCEDGEPASDRCEPKRCSRFEVCTPGSTCRTPRTSCVDGYCRGQRPAVAIPCGEDTCTGERSICCVSEARGTRHCASECQAQEYDIECMKAADCPVYEICLIAPSGHHVCGPFSHNFGVACASDAECPSFDGRTPSVCVHGECAMVE